MSRQRDRFFAFNNFDDRGFHVIDVIRNSVRSRRASAGAADARTAAVRFCSREDFVAPSPGTFDVRSSSVNTESEIRSVLVDAQRTGVATIFFYFLRLTPVSFDQGKRHRPFLRNWCKPVADVSHWCVAPRGAARAQSPSERHADSRRQYDKRHNSRTFDWKWSLFLFCVTLFV